MHLLENMQSVPEAQSDHREALPPHNENTPVTRQTDYKTKVTMYDIYSYPKNKKEDVKLLVMEMTKDLIDRFFIDYGFLTKRNSKLNKRFNCINSDIHYVGITKTHVFLIAPHNKNIAFHRPLVFY